MENQKNLGLSVAIWTGILVGTILLVGFFIGVISCDGKKIKAEVTYEGLMRLLSINGAQVVTKDWFTGNTDFTIETKRRLKKIEEVLHGKNGSFKRPDARSEMAKLTEVYETKKAFVGANGSLYSPDEHSFLGLLERRVENGAKTAFAKETKKLRSELAKARNEAAELKAEMAKLRQKFSSFSAPKNGAARGLQKSRPESRKTPSRTVKKATLKVQKRPLPKTIPRKKDDVTDQM